MYDTPAGEDLTVRVVVLGAAGDMGRTAARYVAAIDGVDHVVFADRDAAHLDAPARPAGGGGATAEAQAVDILDRPALRRLLEPADLVVNCAGPFFRIGPPALEAAIETGTHYLDICDDPQPTAEMLALHEAAAQAGVVAVIGMGASPGLSNLLARRAAQHLDVVHHCYTAWPLDVDGGPADDEPTGGAAPSTADDDSPPAAAIHLMEQIHGTVAVIDDGRLVQHPPLGAVPLDYPGHGPGAGYVVGHPEPLTLLTSLGVEGRGANLMLLSSGITGAFLRGLQADLDGGRLDLAGAATALLAPPAERLQAAVTDGDGLPGAGGLPPFFALVQGEAHGRDLSVGCHLTAFPRGMAEITSIPAALAVAQLLDQLPPAGVHPPEAVIDDVRLLEGLLPHCRPTVATVDELAPVVVTEHARPEGTA